MKAVKPNEKFEKTKQKKTDKTPLIQFELFIFYKPAFLQEIFADDYCLSGCFPTTGTRG